MLDITPSMPEMGSPGYVRHAIPLANSSSPRSFSSRRMDLALSAEWH
jgi:hypothetical protein